MKKVWVYDVEEERLQELCEKHGATTAEIIEALLDLLECEERYNKDILKDLLP